MQISHPVVMLAWESPGSNIMPELLGLQLTDTWLFLQDQNITALSSINIPTPTAVLLPDSREILTIIS